MHFDRRFLASLALLLATVATSASAEDPRPGDAKIVAPTGVLRATFLGSNPAQVKKGPDGELAGIVPDLIREMARRLGVTAEIQPAANAADIVRRLAAHTSDIGFFAYDAKRAQEVDFSDTYALMYNAFVAKADSPIAKTADVDRRRVHVAAVKGQTQLAVLGETLKDAQLQPLDRKPTQPELEALLVTGNVDVYGANRQDAEQIAAESHGRLKALPDNFSYVEQAVVALPGEKDKLVVVNRLVDAMLKDGFVQAALVRMNIAGLSVATTDLPRRP